MYCDGCTLWVCAGACAGRTAGQSEPKRVKKFEGNDDVMPKSNSVLLAELQEAIDVIKSHAVFSGTAPCQHTT